MLQKIYAGPTILQFDRIYIKSKVVRSFSIKNDLRTSIQARLIVDKEELLETSKEIQIIPSCQTGKFDVVLCSQFLYEEFKASVKYVINEKHFFEFEVTASVVKVQVDISPENKSIKLMFDEKNDSMETSEIITLTNKGNDNAKFDWIFAETSVKAFTIVPQSGIVPAGKTIDVKVTYTPSQTGTIAKV